jgi:hypothetical protein
MNKETVETAATKYANKLEADGEHPGAWIINNKGFKAGAEWQKQQEANNAIEFAIWTHKNLWANINDEPLWYNKSRVYQYKTECLTSQQLYELWQKTK